MDEVKDAFRGKIDAQDNAVVRALLYFVLGMFVFLAAVLSAVGKLLTRFAVWVCSWALVLGIVVLVLRILG